MIRFWKKVKIDSLYSCWEWQAGTNKGGYGIFQAAGNAFNAHRVAYILVKGTIPKGHHVHHECDNIICMNPLHLVAISPAAHNAEHKKLAVCRNGHQRTPDNVYSDRSCKQCKREYHIRRTQ